MSKKWPISKLADIADIRVSNVDKKTSAAEQPIRLCNYMDVYSNEYITNSLNFTEGSAKIGEIERFSLELGDVIITKDSETPDDIGIPAVLVETIEGLVCGYHLALIRPKASEVDSVYLAKQLSTARSARYFSLNAGGSTRFGLSVSAIEAIDIPTPPKPEQEKIAEVLSTVDRAIEQTEALIAKQQRIKAGLMHDLLTRGIDEHGNLRSESTHKFKDSPLGRIPAEWNVLKLGMVGAWTSGGTPSKSNPSYWGGDIPWLCPRDMKTFDISLTTEGLTSTGSQYGKRMMPANTVFIVVRGMILAHAFPVCIAGVSMAFNQDVKAIVTASDCEARFLAFWLVADAHNLLKVTTTATHGTKRLDMKDLLSVDIPMPPRDEQIQIIERLNTADAQISVSSDEIAKLRLLKTALMQDLLTGKKRVTPLLEQEVMQ